MFVTFEGIEGCGKSTQAKLLCRWLEHAGFEVLLSKEPGGSGLGRTLRSILLDPSSEGIAPEAELFLYLADRAQHVAEVLRKALQNGAVVIVDRFADSTLVYQGYGRGLDLEELRRLNHLAVQGLEPEMTILLDLPAAQGLSRARSRNAENGQSAREGRFEAEALSFHERIRRGYLELAKAEPGRFSVFDASLSPHALHEEVRRAVAARFRLQAQPHRPL
jgi:dTMP kinase